MKPLAPIEDKQLDMIERSVLPDSLLRSHFAQIEKNLKSLGADRYDLRLPETHALPLIIQANEIIEGVVYGKYSQESASGPIVGRGVLVATDKRILLIDHKPMFIESCEVAYKSVNGINYILAGLAGTVTLHTRLGNIIVRTFNHTCARNFTLAMENKIFTS